MWGFLNDWVLLEFSTVRVVHICQSPFWFSYTSTGPQKVAALISCDFLHLLADLTNFGGGHLSCDLISLINLRRVVYFSICSAFCLLEWSGNFQTSYMLDQKLEVVTFKVAKEPIHYTTNQQFNCRKQAFIMSFLCELRLRVTKYWQRKILYWKISANECIRNDISKILPFYNPHWNNGSKQWTSIVSKTIRWKADGKLF